MSNKKITQLPAASSVDRTDLMPVVTGMFTTPTTKKITVSDFEVSSGTLDDNSPGKVWNIPVVGTDTTNHAWDFKIHGNSFMRIEADGAGSNNITNEKITFGQQLTIRSSFPGGRDAIVYESSTFTNPFPLEGPETFFVMDGGGSGGGVEMIAFTSQDGTATLVGGLVGSTTVTQPAVVVTAVKSDGMGGFQLLDSTEPYFALSLAPIGGPTFVTWYGDGRMRSNSGVTLMQDVTYGTFTHNSATDTPAASTATFFTDRVNISGTGTIDNFDGVFTDDIINCQVTGAAVLVKSNSGGTGNIRMPGGIDDTFNAGDIFSVRFDGTNYWVFGVTHY